jgi:hypothetical protein
MRIEWSSLLENYAHTSCFYRLKLHWHEKKCINMYYIGMPYAFNMNR